ncbi:hypothetical protein GGE65_006323 [Skermanella aerolata]
MLKTMTLHTARFFSVRRETSGNLPDEEGGHEDAAATQR